MHAHSFDLYETHTGGPHLRWDHHRLTYENLLPSLMLMIPTHAQVKDQKGLIKKVKMGNSLIVYGSPVS